MGGKVDEICLVSGRLALSVRRGDRFISVRRESARHGLFYLLLPVLAHRSVPAKVIGWGATASHVSHRNLLISNENCFVDVIDRVGEATGPREGGGPADSRLRLSAPSTTAAPGPPHDARTSDARRCARASWIELSYA